MTYKETLFFIGKCLTISHEEENLQSVTEQIKTNNVDWDAVVKVSTSHYVFPALYCNLLRANLLSYLPEELVAYMKHITDLNRERNLQIIEQAKEINELLLKNEITPIFLKGTGNLLSGLYEDVAERMVGDIDFLVSYDDYEKTIKTLNNADYSAVYVSKYHFPYFKHYQRIQKEGLIAAIEIHKEMLLEKYADEFNYNTIKKNHISENDISFLGYEDQLTLTSIAYQINDAGQYRNSISLRNGYDVFLLSKKTNTLHSIKRFEKLFYPLNNFLAVCNKTFNSSIPYEETNYTEEYLTVFDKILSDGNFRESHSKKINRKLFIKTRLNVIYKSIYKKEYRYWLFKRITDPSWQKEKMNQLKSKSNS